jgi:hypothetical protein
VSTATGATVRGNPELVVRRELVPPPVGWLKWVGTTDHKRIGVMYIVTSFMFFLIGGSEALLMRSQLAVPNNTLVDAAHYNQILTLHGTTMVFLFIVPIWAGLANYLVPLQIGARDMAFPRLNALPAGSSSTDRSSSIQPTPAGSHIRRSRTRPTHRAAARTRGSS